MTSTQVTHTAYDRDVLERLADSDEVILNLGCGTDDVGIGIDIHYEPDIQADLNDGIPVADDVADRVIAKHVLEHLNNPTQFCAELARVLHPDGEARLAVPNAGWLPVRMWLSQDLHRFWSHKTPGQEGHWLARRLGNPDRERTAHRSLWTKQLLAEHLERAGLAYEIEGHHLSRNFDVRAWLPTGGTPGQTLHELERDSGGDLASGDYWARTRAGIIARWVDEHGADRVLDVGCGSGYLTARIADAGHATDVVGVDVSEESIAVARRRETTASFHVADAFALEYPPDSFDVLIFGDVLEHFEQPERLLEETQPLLQPDGRLIVSVPAFRLLYGPHDEHNDHHDRYTTERLAAVAERAGYQLERARYTNTVPLLPYLVYQRILKRPIPSGVRGGHSGPLAWLKDRLISIEQRVSFPVGVTLLAEFSHA